MTDSPGTLKPAGLVDLLARVEAAEGPNFALEEAIHDAFTPKRRAGRFPDGTPIPANWGGRLTPPAYTASLDAALGLVERVLPGWLWDVGKERGGYSAQLGCDAPRIWISDIDGPTPALAILSALLKALIAKETDMASSSPVDLVSGVEG